MSSISVIPESPTEKSQEVASGGCGATSAYIPIALVNDEYYNNHKSSKAKVNYSMKKTSPSMQEFKTITESEVETEIHRKETPTIPFS